MDPICIEALSEYLTIDEILSQLNEEGVSNV